MEFWTDNSHPSASDSGPGSKDQPTKTINAALRLAGPGDSVVVAPGVYRETVTPVKGGKEGEPITIRSLVPRAAIVRGSEILQEAPLAPGKHVLELPAELVAMRNPFAMGASKASLAA